jgi:hypothetical protein
MLTTDQKRAIAETAIVHAATKLEIDVYSPIAEGSRCDFIFDLGTRLWRVQCKWAALDGDVIVIRCYSCRRGRHGMIKRPYTADEIDAFVAYCMPIDRCFFIPLDAIGSQTYLQLRLAPARNNQKLGIKWAADYDFAARLGALGAVAQLGERLAGSQKGTGSSPVGSITPP